MCKLTIPHGCEGHTKQCIPLSCVWRTLIFLPSTTTTVKSVICSMFYMFSCSMHLFNFWLISARPTFCPVCRMLFLNLFIAIVHHPSGDWDFSDTLTPPLSLSVILQRCWMYWNPTGIVSSFGVPENDTSFNVQFAVTLSFMLFVGCVH